MKPEAPVDADGTSTTPIMSLVSTVASNVELSSSMCPKNGAVHGKYVLGAEKSHAQA